MPVCYLDSNIFFAICNHIIKIAMKIKTILFYIKRYKINFCHKSSLFSGFVAKSANGYDLQLE